MNNGLSKTKNPMKFDFILLAFLIVTAITSLVAIFSAFGVIGEAKGMDYITKQLMWYVISFIIFSFICYIGNDNIYQIARVVYFILLGLLIILLLDKFIHDFTGRDLPFISTVNGSTSWFAIPGLGSLQPSEFMKICLIIIEANVIQEHFEENTESSFQSDFELFLQVLKWAIAPMLLILLQPDTGIVMIISISLIIMLICSGIRKEWIIVIGILVIVVLILFFYLYYFHFDFLNKIVGGDGGYKLRRVTSWLNPESDTSGDGMQLYTALLTLGSAGFSGHGMGQLVVSIPEAQTDFIFAMIGQSFGFIGGVFVILLCCGLDIYLCYIARNSRSIFEKFITIGVLSILLFQHIQNIGMIIGLLPITGITLPMISYGGSSLLSYMIAFGVIMNITSKIKNDQEYS